MDFAEEIRDFLIESNENLAALDQEIVELEKNPRDEKLIASVFRTIHTVKGTSGFFGFKLLGSIAHVAENILGQVREKQRDLTPELVTLVLLTIDAIRAILAQVETDGTEGDEPYDELKAKLEDAYQYRDAAGEALQDHDALAAVEAPAVVSETASETDVATTVPAVLLHAAADEQKTKEPVAAPAPTALPAAQTSQPKEQPIEHLGGIARPEPGIVTAAERRTPDPRRSIDALKAATAAAASERPQESAESGGAANSTIRVDVSLLDKLMNLVGELVLARNQILQGAANAGNSSGTAQRLNLITSELQEGVMRTRMQPIGMVWNKLPRVVRDLAASVGKKIEIQMEGAETELDKTIIEAIKDPLTHIVRNSCDHGIESPEARVAKGKSAQGTILLRAFHEGGHVNIEISDDGAGIDPVRIRNKAIEKGLIRAEQAALMNEWESLRLIFLPGFSTAETITSISGRGVGMDVVKTNIEKISGSVDLSNRMGAGSTIKIKIPLTLAIIPGLIVSVKEGPKESAHEQGAGEDERSDGADTTAAAPNVHRFVIPQANLLELVRLEGEKDRRQVEKINGAEVYRRRGKLLPLAHLSQVLGLRPNPAKSSDGVMNIVIVQAEETAFGLVVDEVNDTQEIVVKALGKQLKALSCYVGATIMGDGKIALILDVTGIAKLAHMLSQPVERSRTEARGNAESEDARQMLLLFRSGKFPRLVLPLALVARLEEFPTARIEYAAGAPVLRYREAILPLIWLSSLLDPGSSQSGIDEASIQVIVFSEGDRYIGIVVDEILDIVDDAVTIRRPSTAFGLLGSGVVGGKVTDFVDLGTLLDAARGSAAGSLDSSPGRGRRLMLVDSAKMARGVLRGYLEIHGHTVVEAAGPEDAAEMIEHVPVDLITTSLHAGDVAGAAFFSAMRSRPGAPPIPVLGLTGENDALDRGEDSGQCFDQSVGSHDRVGILRAIEALTARSMNDTPADGSLVTAEGAR